MLFEAQYKVGYDYFIRAFNPDTGRSESYQIPGKFEYFKPMSNGSYTYLLDGNMKLARYLGTRKEAEGAYGVRSPDEHYIRDHFWQTKSFNLNPRVWYLDIETRSGQVTEGFPEAEFAMEQITLIQVFDTVNNAMIVMGLRDFSDPYNKLSELEYPVKYIKCSDEINLLQTFYKVFRALNPLIIYAWNGIRFDFPYLYNRTKNLGLDPNLLSNYGMVTCEYKDGKDGKEVKFRSNGHFFIDMIDVYKTITIVNKPSYSLEYISQCELKQGKVDHSEFMDFDSFYTGEKYHIADTPYDDQVREEIRQLKIKQRDGNFSDSDKDRLTQLLQFQFVYYGVKDVYLLKLIDKKKNLTNIICSKSCTMGVNFSDALGTLKPWGSYLLNEFYKEKIICPSDEERTEKVNIIGGFVRDPIKGKHHWIISEDVNSMYPMLSMAGSNMSPETFIPVHKAPMELRELILAYYNDQDENRLLNLDQSIKDKTRELLVKYNCSMGINGALFSNVHIGLIPKLVLDIYNGRKKDKKTMLKYDRAYEKFRSLLKTASDGESSTDIKDPLEYLDNEELLQGLSKSQLEKLIDIAESKSNFYNTEQYVKKILINSLYGALGNPNFVLFNEKIAQAITGNGRYFIQMTANNMENYLQSLIKSEKPYVMYGDTDSFYTQIEPIMSKYIAENPGKSLNDYVDYADKFELDNMQPIVQKSIENFAELFNAYNPGVIGMKRENIMPVAVFVAKKKYFASVMDSEGTRYPEDDPHIKVMGLELARATTPNWCKKYLSEAMKFILNNDPAKLSQWIDNIKNSFTDADVQDLAMNGSVKSVNYKLDDKSIPWMSKAAIYHNMFVKENKLEGEINLLKGGDKCKLIMLKTPNRFRTDRIAYTSDAIIPYVKDCIDYDQCFEKTFINPLQNILDALNIDLKAKTCDLADW